MVNPRRPCVISLAPATSSSSESLVKRYVSSRCLPTLVYGRSNGNWKTLRCATWSRSCTRKSDLLLDERRVDREQYIEDVLAQLRQELQQLISREKSVDGPSTSTAKAGFISFYKSLYSLHFMFTLCKSYPQSYPHLCKVPFFKHTLKHIIFR